MNESTVGAALLTLQDAVSVELATTPAHLQEAYQLRHQVYCVERGYEKGEDGIERDDYDAFAHHAVVRWRETGTVVGTVRLVLPKVRSTGDDFPIQHVCDPDLLRDLPFSTIGEVSRFALAKLRRQEMRQVSTATCAMLRFALIRGAVRMSAEAGHTHWLAVMEPTLLRLLSATGLHFKPLGQPVEYHGLRQPAVAELVPTLARLHAEQPLVWKYITQDGTWYPESRSRSSNAPREVVDDEGRLPSLQTILPAGQVSWRAAASASEFIPMLPRQHLKQPLGRNQIPQDGIWYPMPSEVHHIGL
jgi:N-acyl amino acid synthase of PEP-CTERM/exosortase system